MRKKKLLFVCESVGGGVRRHIIDLLNNLDFGKYEISFIYGVDERVDSVFKEAITKFEKMGVKFFQIKEMQREIKLSKDLKSMINMIGIMKKIRPHIVHCHSSKAGALGRVAAKLTGVKKILYTPHSYIFLDENMSSKKRVIYIYMEKLLAYFGDLNIHVSYGEEEKAISYGVIKENKSIVVYNGVGTFEGKSQINKEERFIIGTIARIDYQKNPLGFIKIAENICRKMDGVDFYYIGGGEKENEIKQYINTKNLNHRVHLLGFKGNATEYLLDFDVFLSTSLYEGLPYTLIEAVSAGVPIVASDVIGNNEVVSDSINGFLFNVDDISTAVLKIEEILYDKDLRISMRKNSANLYKKKYNLNFMINKYEEIYDEL